MKYAYMVKCYLIFISFLFLSHILIKVWIWGRKVATPIPFHKQIIHNETWWMMSKQSCLALNRHLISNTFCLTLLLYHFCLKYVVWNVWEVKTWLADKEWEQDEQNWFTVIDIFYILHFLFEFLGLNLFNG